MENLFLHYMQEWERRNEDRTAHDMGPVITISREYGCYGSEIANKLVDRINNHIASKGNKNEWVFVSHQVLHDASETLDSDPNKIAHIFGAEEKTIFGDLVALFSKDKYVSDIQIKRTIAQIVRSYSEQGNAVIIGRAGCVLAKHIKNSLHARIIAPFNWRVNEIKTRFNLSNSDAVEKVKDTDKRRETFMDFFRGNKPDSELFDIILNRSTLTTEAIVDQIFYLALKKGLL